MAENPFYCVSSPVAGTPLALRFQKGSETRVINPQNFKTLGIFDQIENWAYGRGHPIYMWGTAVCDYSSILYKNRPWLKIPGPVEYTIAGDSKILLVNYNDTVPQIWSETVEISSTDFNSTNFTLGANISVEASVNIGVVSSRASSEVNFNTSTSKSQTLTYSRITTVTMSASAGNQIRAVTNPTYNTTFEVQVVGEIWIWGKDWLGRWNWYDAKHAAQVTTKDNGSTVYINEPIPGWSSGLNVVVNEKEKHSCVKPQIERRGRKTVRSDEFHTWDLKLPSNTKKSLSELQSLLSPHLIGKKIVAIAQNDLGCFYCFDYDLEEEEVLKVTAILQ